MVDPIVQMPNAIDHVITSTFATLNRFVRPAVKSGFASPPPLGVGLVVLETSGRRSGLPRQVPLLAARAGRHVRVTTGRSGSQWMRNLEADDAPSVWVGGRKRNATATVTRGPVSVATLATTR